MKTLVSYDHLEAYRFGLPTRHSKMPSNLNWT